MQDTDPLLSSTDKNQTEKVKKKYQDYLIIKRNFQIDFGDLLDVLIILMLAFFGILTRIYKIQFPKKFVMNEDLIEEQINKYFNGDYFQEFPNPPITSIFYFYISKAANYNGQMSYSNTDEYDKINSERFYIQFRAISAIFSGLSVPLVYCVFRIIIPFSKLSSLLSNRITSIACSSLYLFETSLISQGRYLFIDGLFQFFFILSLFIIFYEDYICNLTIFILKNFIISILFTISPIRSFGLIVSVIFKNFINYRPREFIIFRCAFSRTIFLLLFLLLFQYIQYFIHFSLLPYKSESTERYGAFINNILISKNETNLRKRSEKATFFNLFLHSTYLIIFHNSGNKHFGYESNPLKWPFGNFLKGIPYADNYNHTLNPKDAVHHYYFCLPNVFIYALVVIFIIIATIGLFMGIDLTIQQRIKKFCQLVFFLVGYIFSLVPFFFVSHSYFYQYSSSLIFGIFLISYLIQIHFKPNKSIWISLFFILFSFIEYLIISPYIYGHKRPYRPL